MPGRVLVRFRPGANGAAIAAANGGSIEAQIALAISMVIVPPGLEKHLAGVLAANPHVEFAEPDYYRTTGVPCGTGTCEPPNDTFWGYKWDLHNDGYIRNSTGNPLSPTGLVDADMDWLEAYEMLGDFQGGAVIGILDTGIRSTHQEFTGRILAEYDFVRNRPGARDRDGHGTHVAGIAGARGANGSGVTGVAYGPNIHFVIARVCDAFCPTSAIVNAITWAVDNGANVLNLSLGGPSGSASEQQALQYARANNVLPFCAAGNSGVPSVDYPARFPECVAVSATDWSDGLASYSSWGTEVELSAPGDDDENNNGYAATRTGPTSIGRAWTEARSTSTGWDGFGRRPPTTAPTPTRSATGSRTGT